MQFTLALTTLLMGIVGGPHCIVMCGSACAAIRQGGGQETLLKFHFGRILGYATVGASAAISVNSLAWVSNQSLALHPLWTFFHVMVMSWGLVLLAYARQPVWANSIGHEVWKQVQHYSNLRGGALITGMLWSLMPCGLLYSALMVASLSGSPVNGAVSMAAFALGSSVSLMLGPLLWLKLLNTKKRFNEGIGMRLAGLVLAFTGAWAIWMDLSEQLKIWCN